MRTKDEITERLQSVVREEDLNPDGPMFKYTHAYPKMGKSTRGYTHGFYAGFFRALEWALENPQSSKEGTKNV